MQEMLEQIIDIAAKVRATVPLVHNITNYVTVNDVANAELAIGGSALMADDIDEVRDMVSIARCTNINMGTLDARTIESMVQAVKVANELGVASVFDPVGAGASQLRNQTARRLLAQTEPTVVRGNLSEISFVAGLGASTKGVDSSDADAGNDPVAVAASIARERGCVVAITGAVDVITDGATVVKIANGLPMMGKITGTGCMCDGVIGCFVGALDDLSNSRDVVAATAGAICSVGLSAERAYARLQARDGRVGTGSLHIGIIDELSLLDEAAYREGAHVECLELA